jgi:uncharacterized repeat protein (TIGR02543 family)
MQQKGVTKTEWDAVRVWGLTHGYNDLAAGGGKAVNHPVIEVSWYDVVKWCNARSEKESLTPCYYTDAAQTTIYKTGTNNIGNTMVKWPANGYRLPTEAEREKAARGGLSGKRFPWGDTITHSQANYNASPGSVSYDVSLTSGLHPTYFTGGYPFTSPVGSFAANGYGIYDMAGNLLEWCWDWYDGSYYATAPGTDPTGPGSGTNRVLRGGSWGYGAYLCRAAHRDTNTPSFGFFGYGFRPARNAFPANYSNAQTSDVVVDTRPDVALTTTALHGTVTGAGDYAPDTTATLTATPAPGYLFTGWMGDATGNANPLSVLMDAAKTIGATFSPDTADDDEDGLTNFQEIVETGTNPALPDTDGDGANDNRDAFPLDPAETLDTDHDGIGDNADLDDDGDGYSDTDEINLYHTNPKRADSDGDGLSDPAEIETHHTNPNVADGDNDGLRDGEEVNTQHTNPLVGDSDGDGFLDGYEVLTGKSPLDAQDKPALVAEARTAIEFTFPAAIGKTYRIEDSPDLVTWSTVEAGIAGTGATVQRFYSTRGQAKRYFRVEDEAP